MTSAAAPTTTVDTGRDASGPKAPGLLTRVQLVHKRHVTRLFETGGSAAALSAYGLERVDRRALELAPDAVVACLVVRNEAARLDAVLSHHRRLGVERFFVVDNGSTDDTLRMLGDQADVRVWSSTMPFRAANYGAAWFEVLLRAFASGHWVVIVDADELLWYAECETRPLHHLCEELDAAGHRALGAVLLDMYGREPLADTRLPRSCSPLTVCRYFDRRWFHGMESRSGVFRNQVGYHGGVRRRVFGGAPWDYYLNRVPLLRYDIDTVLVGGQHATNLALAPSRGAVLHFKLDDGLAHFARLELERGQRAAHASEYHAYAETLALNPDLTLYDPAESVSFEGSAQLVDLGILGPSPDVEELERHAAGMVQRACEVDEPARAITQLRRAAEVVPTAVEPLVRIARLSHERGDTAGAKEALEEAAARHPSDLSLLELVDDEGLAGPLTGCDTLDDADLATAPMPMPKRSVSRARLDLLAAGAGATRRSRWGTALRALAPLHADGAVLFDEFVDATFGWADRLRFEPRVHAVPWVGCVHAVPEPPEHLVPFTRGGLPALWATPELQRSLDRCQGLFTFTDRAAAWIRERVDVPVAVVPRPADPTGIRFDLAAFARNPDRRLVQPGWWMARLNSICDLPLLPGNPLQMRKVRAVPPARRRLAIGLAHAERCHDAWSGDAQAILHTREVPLVADERTRALTADVVFADLYDANADPVVVECMSTATPIVVNRQPGVVEHLGADYPLYFDSSEEAAAKAVDLAAVEAAHRHLTADAVRERVAPDTFLASIRDSAVCAGLA
jgi:hypothetical protein